MNVSTSQVPDNRLIGWRNEFGFEPLAEAMGLSSASPQ